MSPIAGDQHPYGDDAEARVAAHLAAERRLRADALALSRTPFEHRMATLRPDLRAALASLRSSVTDMDTPGPRYRRGIGFATAEAGNGATMAWQAASAELIVDCETGFVSLLRHAVRHRLGRGADRAMVGRSIEAGIMQGLGIAFRERGGRGAYGAAWLAARPMPPSILDLPATDIDFVDDAGAAGPGHDDVAVSRVNVAAAIVEAIVSATGLDIAPPLSPERVLSARLAADRDHGRESPGGARHMSRQFL